MEITASSRQLMAWICQLEDLNPFPLSDTDDLISFGREQGLLSQADFPDVYARLVGLIDRGLLEATDPLGKVEEPVEPEDRARAMSHLRSTAQGRQWAQTPLEHSRDAEAASLRHKSPRDPQKVAVMYGRDGAARRVVFDLIRRLGLEPLEWDELVDRTGSAAPYNGEAVSAAFAVAQAVVVVLTPDDVGYLHPSLQGNREREDDREPTGQPRLNVVLEAGMALQSHPTQTVLVEIGRTRDISDLAGRNTVRLDGSASGFNSLANRLERADCPVRRTGADWLDFPEFPRLDALTREPGRSPAVVHDYDEDTDDIALEVRAAAERADVELTERQISFLVKLVTSTTEPFTSHSLRPSIPAPKPMGGSMNRLLRELHFGGLIGRNDGPERGYRPQHPVSVP